MPIRPAPVRLRRSPELDPVDAQLWIITDDLEDPDTITTVLWPTDY